MTNIEQEIVFYVTAELIQRYGLIVAQQSLGGIVRFHPQSRSDDKLLVIEFHVAMETKDGGTVFMDKSFRNSTADSWREWEVHDENMRSKSFAVADPKMMDKIYEFLDPEFDPNTIRAESDRVFPSFLDDD